MTQPDVSLRPAVAADLAAIVEVFWACWSQTYATVLPRLAERFDRPAANALWERVLADPESGTTLVAVLDEQIVGTTRYRAGVDDAAGHVSSLYVSPAAQGRGVGRRLLTAAVEAMAAAGTTDATLWVFAANTPSLDFYARLGWTLDGETRLQEEFGEPEVRMHRTLGGSP